MSTVIVTLGGGVGQTSVDVQARKPSSGELGYHFGYRRIGQTSSHLIPDAPSLRHRNRTPLHPPSGAAGRAFGPILTQSPDWTKSRGCRLRVRRVQWHLFGKPLRKALGPPMNFGLSHQLSAEVERDARQPLEGERLPWGWKYDDS